MVSRLKGRSKFIPRFKRFRASEELVHLLRLSVPVSLSLLGGLLMQLVDTIFVGPLGPVAIGGVSVGNAVFSTLMVIGIGVSFGLDYLVSHAFGAGKLEECHRYLVQSLFASTAIAFVFTALMQATSFGFGWFGIEPAVAVEGGRYLRGVSWSLWPFLLFSAYRQYLQAMGVAMPVLLILLLANLVNALGNWIFIYGHFGFPAMGVSGSALATDLARVFMLVCIVAYALGRDRKLNLGLSRVPLRFERERAKQLVRLGLPSGLQMLFEVGVFALATLLAGRLGAVPLAAHHVVLHLASTVFMVPLGLSSAAAVRVGQALGAGEVERGIRTGWISLQVGLVIACTMAATLYFAAGPLLGIFTKDPEVLAIGRSLMLVAALFQISDATQVIGAGVLRGVGNTKASMYFNLAGHWLMGLPVGYALCFVLGFGAKGLWLGLSVGLTSVALSLVYFWRWRTRELRRGLQGRVA